MKNVAARPFALFAAAALITGAALAQNSTSGATLMSSDATLIHALNTKSAAPGQIVTVQLTDSIRTPEGVELPHGTQLLGKIDTVEAAKDRGPAKLTLTFSQARLKDGKTLPVKATLVSFSSANDPAELPLPVSADGVFDQVAGAIGDTALHSAVKDDTSGTLTSKRGDIKLPEGTQFLVALDQAPSQTVSGAE
ncbi:hypothetical protein [Silvibacterium dinghuense]|uniref:Uncharacterized protein n=1 Tax=Silvibacterium dinghuense TaxID=1560006 RepID=A0A4Q1SJQ8_9BACT|nr:hypothetical protein [Silvibacterium dinghuense]RXS97891.1 hypothetical protein ESZ00_08550 [Silvibacterium dinghuense]GGH02780.1 hypothetical protein GCM10011586_18290 [Silvibacterium dinghuense]